MHHKDLRSDPLKTKALLMAFTGKAAFNIGGTTIHSALHIPINQSLSNLGKLSTETLSKLTDQYEQLQFIVLDEVSLVGARMLNAIDQRLRSIKHVQNKVFGGVDVIVTGDFYQAPLVRDKWVFQKPDEGLNAIAPNFWHDHIK
jgi:ATP-dependent DNA helicase PIF1